MVPNKLPRARKYATTTHRVDEAQNTYVAMFPSLEAEHLVLKLADRPCLLVSQSLGSLLERRNHRRRAAHEDLDIGGGSGELRLDHVCGDEADAAVPLLRRVVEHVVDPELAVLGGDGVDVLLEQNVLGVDVGKDEVDLGLVACCAAALDGLDDLQHGRNAGAAGDHTEVAHEVGCVDHGALGAAHLDRLADLHGSDMLGDVTGRVRLDEEVDVAVVFVGGDGRVRADDFFAADGGGEGDVLADGEAEDIGRAGEGKTVAVDCLALVLALTRRRTEAHMAVLCERTVFSVSSNSWNSVGLRTLRGAANALEIRPEQATSEELLLTVTIHLPAAQHECQSCRKRQPFLLHEGGADEQQRRGEVHALDILRCEQARHGDEFPVRTRRVDGGDVGGQLDRPRGGI